MLTMDCLWYWLYGLQEHVPVNVITCLTQVNVWEAMGKPCSCVQFIKSRIFYCKSRAICIRYHRAASERAMKLEVHMIKSLSP